MKLIKLPENDSCWQFLRAGTAQDIARITAPTLVIHGEDDPLLPLAAGKEVADLIPKSEFLALPRMGHDLPPIHFETITRAIASHVWQAEA